ncbi:MAG: class I SAM-dependent methyltransferase [Anaerolineaceae bacterium]
MTINDPRYLKKFQYRDPTNLNSRITIHTLYSITKQTWADFVFEQLQPSAGERILELGCGHAAQWQTNLERLPPGARLTLSDLSTGMVKEARHALAAVGRATFLNQEAQTLAFSEQIFDVVITNHMLYHVPSPTRAIQEAARVLKPGGRLIAATNGAGHMAELDFLLHEFEPRFEAETAMSRPFSLENGREQIEAYFGSVELIPYASDLWVTDAEPLADYVFSTPTGQIWFCKDQIGDMSAFFQRRIDRDGGIFIHKSTGIFRANQPRK